MWKGTLLLCDLGHSFLTSLSVLLGTARIEKFLFPQHLLTLLPQDPSFLNFLSSPWELPTKFHRVCDPFLSLFLLEHLLQSLRVPSWPLLCEFPRLPLRVPGKSSGFSMPSRLPYWNLPLGGVSVWSSLSLMTTLFSVS